MRPEELGQLKLEIFEGTEDEQIFRDKYPKVLKAAVEEAKKMYPYPSDPQFQSAVVAEDTGDVLGKHVSVVFTDPSLPLEDTEAGTGVSVVYGRLEGEELVPVEED